jgi:hypothetical protein
MFQVSTNAGVHSWPRFLQQESVVKFDLLTGKYKWDAFMQLFSLKIPAVIEMKRPQ